MKDEIADAFGFYAVEITEITRWWESEVDQSGVPTAAAILVLASTVKRLAENLEVGLRDLRREE